MKLKSKIILAIVLLITYCYYHQRSSLPYHGILVNLYKWIVNDSEYAKPSYVRSYFEPIDVVYTWVNGSDPKHVKSFNYHKFKDVLSLSEKIDLDAYFSTRSLTSKTCYHKNCLKTGNLFIVIPKIDPLNRSLLDGQKTLNANLTITDVTMNYEIQIPELMIHNLSIVTLNNYQNADHIYSMFKRRLSRHKVYVGFYTSDCSLAYNCIRKVPETYILKRKRSNLMRILSFLNKKDDLEIMFGRADESIRNVYNIYEANIVWDLGQPLGDAFAPNRFMDKNELKYSLRSLELYVPWIRNVYLVTNGQVPDWLNLAHPKLRLIQHEQIFANKSHLPTFNSAAIEMNLHRIGNLSNRFIYFNDDVLVTSPVRLSDFYSPDGILKIYTEWRLFFVSQVFKCDDPSEYACSLRYTYALLDRKFERAFSRGVPPHMPFLVDKTIIQQMERMFADQMQKTSSNKFRSRFDLQYSFAFSNFIAGQNDRFNSFDKFETVVNEALVKLNVSLDTFLKCAKSSSGKFCQRLVDAFKNDYLTNRDMYKFESVRETILEPIVLKEPIDIEKYLSKFKNPNNRVRFVCFNDNIDYTNESKYIAVMSSLNRYFQLSYANKSSFEN